MTFTQIKTRIMSFCALSSTEADTRIGIAINEHYRRVTASLGLEPVRFVTRSVAMTIGVQTVTFTEIEKIDRILDTTDSAAVRLITETSVHEIRSAQPGSDQPSTWALQNTDADSVVAIFDTVPQTAYSLTADGTSTLGYMSGSDEPLFSESFHDILSFLVIAEEMLKKEKIALAREFSSGDENKPGRAETAIRDLRFKIADSPTRDTQQGSSTATPGSSSSGSSGTVGGTSYTQTGLITFDRDPSAPFSVTSSSAKVDNLDADKLDGYDESAFAKLADNETITGTWAFPNTGLTVKDTDSSHVLSIVPGSNITANRVLTLTTGDAARTITLSGNPTLADWFDQAVKAASTPTFAGAAFGANSLTGALSFGGIANTGLKVLDTDASHVLSIVPGSNITANRTLTLTTGDAARTITLSGDPTLADWFDQSVKVAATPTFGATTITGALTISGASAGQVVFPGTQNASAGANTLDDYEEGVWTPVIGGSGGTSGQTYSLQDGKYVKVGQLVVATFDADLSAKGTITTNVQIQGLPFASMAQTGALWYAAIGFHALLTNWIYIGASFEAAGTAITLRGTAAAGTSNVGTALAAADIGNSTILRGTIVYRASA